MFQRLNNVFVIYRMKTVKKYSFLAYTYLPVFLWLRIFSIWLKIFLMVLEDLFFVLPGRRAYFPYSKFSNFLRFSYTYCFRS